MKAILLTLFVALLMVGCGEEQPVDYSKLQDRDGIMYLPNEETPFNGRAEDFYWTGQKKLEANYKDGKLDGLWTLWYINGQKKREGNSKDGKEDGLWTQWYLNGQKNEESNWKAGKPMSAKGWKPNGEKCPVTDVKDGNGVVVWYNEDGTEYRRLTYKDGDLVRD
jgi:antitoxin component YwqK of YwqJK toxin-antitoxin module